MSPQSARELATYFRFTLELVEKSPRRYRDDLAADRLAMLLRDRTELEREMESRPAHSNFFRFLARIGSPHSSALDGFV